MVDFTYYLQVLLCLGVELGLGYMLDTAVVVANANVSKRLVHLLDETATYATLTSLRRCSSTWTTWIRWLTTLSGCKFRSELEKSRRQQPWQGSPLMRGVSSRLGPRDNLLPC